MTTPGQSTPGTVVSHLVTLSFSCPQPCSVLQNLRMLSISACGFVPACVCLFLHTPAVARSWIPSPLKSAHVPRCKLISDLAFLCETVTASELHSPDTHRRAVLMTARQEQGIRASVLHSPDTHRAVLMIAGADVGGGYPVRSLGQLNLTHFSVLMRQQPHPPRATHDLLVCLFSPRL